MAATGTLTYSFIPAPPGGEQSLVLTWTSDASGNVTQAVPVFNGVIHLVKFVPSAAAPTNGYAATLPDQDAIDLFGGLGASLSSTTAKADTPTLSAGFPIGVTTGARTTLTIAGAGNAKSGTITINYR